MNQLKFAPPIINVAVKIFGVDLSAMKKILGCETFPFSSVGYTGSYLKLEIYARGGLEKRIISAPRSRLANWEAVMADANMARTASAITQRDPIITAKVINLFLSRNFGDAPELL